VTKQNRLSVTVVGAGILGLWQAYELSRRGHCVTVREALPRQQTGASSRYAGAMLAPYCEAEAAEPIVERLGLRGLELWRAANRHVVAKGSLVVAAARDRAELTRFARLTSGHKSVTAKDIEMLEPELASRFQSGLYFPDEAHLAPRPGIDFLVAELERLGTTLRFGDAVHGPLQQAAAAGEAVIDCRGMAARAELPDLRGVRGEMIVLRAPEVVLSRPVRLLHPRFPIYVVPWERDVYMVGATVIERDDMGPVTVRSALELLGTAYALHSGFAEAEIVELSAGVRPSFTDNIPKVVARGRVLHVNGAYRHGFLLAPALAEIVADYLETGRVASEVFIMA
jgi:glycine oxidase